MGAFELNNTLDITAECRKNTEECIIAQKIFDQCRIQKCCTPAILGPARAARNIPTCNEMLCEGDIIVPPCNAASVTLKNTKLSNIDIVCKKPNPLRTGCWDIELKYVFHYDLEFRKADGCPIGCIAASSVYNLKVTLFGSTETEVTVASDLYHCGENPAGGPFVSAEGKAVGLLAELKYPCNYNCGCNCGCGCDTDDSVYGAPVAVNVTIGLFTIVKMFRTVNMLIHSLGNCVPEECSCPSSANPCDFFDRLAFPMDIFAPNDPPHSCCGTGNCSSCDKDCNCGNGSSCNNDCNSNCGCGSTCGNDCNNSCGCNTNCNSNCNTNCNSNCGCK